VVLRENLADPAIFGLPESAEVVILQKAAQNAPLVRFLCKAVSFFFGIVFFIVLAAVVCRFCPPTFALNE
jgi:hypothetical protein